jgi:hypothetical protein
MENRLQARYLKDYGLSPNMDKIFFFSPKMSR